MVVWFFFRWRCWLCERSFLLLIVADMVSSVPRYCLSATTLLSGGFFFLFFGTMELVAVFIDTFPD